MQTLEQLYDSLELNISKKDMEKTASSQAGSKLEDIWNQTMRYESNAVSETHNMEDNMNVFQKMAMNKQAAAEEKALDTMCIGAAYDHLSGNMTKSASMQKVALEKRAAGQNLILQHCAQFGFNPEYCINKEASDFQIDSEIEKLHKRAQYVAQLVMAGFNKAAADSADTNATAATMGNGMPMEMPTDVSLGGKAQTFAQPSGPMGPSTSTTVDGAVAKMINGSNNYAAQGKINHSFLSSSTQMA